MPHITARDGTRLYYEEAGSGSAVVFVHEYAGDYRTWEPQMRHFSRVASLRHLQPARLSAVRRAGRTARKYSQDIARDDVIALMDALKIDKAHVVGHSMGAYTALHVGINASEALHFGRRGRLRLGLERPMPKKREEMKRARRRDRQDVRRGGHRGGGGEICRRADAPGAEEQGPARLRRIRRACWRSIRRSAMR